MFNTYKNKYNITSCCLKHYFQVNHCFILSCYHLSELFMCASSYLSGATLSNEKGMCSKYESLLLFLHLYFLKFHIGQCIIQLFNTYGNYFRPCERGKHHTSFGF